MSAGSAERITPLWWKVRPAVEEEDVCVLPQGESCMPANISVKRWLSELQAVYLLEILGTAQSQRTAGAGALLSVTHIAGLRQCNSWSQAAVRVHAYLHLVEERVWYVHIHA